MLIIKRKASLTLTILLIVTNAIAIFTVVIITLGYLKILLVAAILLNLYRCLTYHALLSSKEAIIKVTFTQNSQSLLSKDQKFLPSILVGEIFLTNYLTILRCQVIGTSRCHNIVIVKDGIDSKDKDIMHKITRYFAMHKHKRKTAS